MAKLNLEEEGDVVFIEVNLQTEICNVVNMEFAREVKYWKALAVGDPKLLEEGAPKRRELRSKKKKNSKVNDINTVLRELQSKYQGKTPQIDYLPPPPSGMITLEEVHHQLEKCLMMARATDNFTLKNAYTFGSWLIVAEKHFKREKYLIGTVLPKQFGMWIRTFGISRQSADTYKRVYKLIHKVPRLINWQISITYLMKNCSLERIF